MPTDTAATEDVRAELGRILANPAFSLANRLRRFLIYVVDQTLAGEESQLKEYTIGLEVFDRGQDFDPRLDPIVRVEAGRVRQKLLRYYESDGRESRLRIELPKGTYVPRIEMNRTTRAASRIPPTLAVLSFTDLSSNRDQLYLCEGMTEELIRALTKVAGLRVFAAKSRSSAKYVLEGGLRRDGVHMRVTAKLMNSRSGEFVWAENYDSEFAEVFSVQEKISRAIVNALQIQLRHEPLVLAPAATGSSIAYRLYLKARHHWNLRTPEGLLEAVRLFEKSIENDPEFGLAYAGLADSHSLLGNYSVLAPMEARHRAKEAAESAVSLSPGMAETHTSMAHVLATCEWNWEEAEHEYELAIELNPHLSTSHHWYAITCLMPQQRLAEAEFEITEAAALDPASISISRDVAVINWAMRDYAAAVERVQETLALAFDFHEGYWVLGLAFEQMHEYDRAIEAFQRGRAIRPTARLIGALGHGLALAGRSSDARKIIIELTELSQERYVSPFDFAVVWLGLGEVDHAFELLARAFQDRCYELLWLAVDPRWDALRTDPRFLQLAIRA